MVRLEAQNFKYLLQAAETQPRLAPKIASEEFI